MSTVTFNPVEETYFNLYNLGIKYKEADEDAPFTPDDLGNLKNLCALCPASYGAGVYQARALFQLITGTVFNGDDNCADAGARKGRSEEQSNKLQQSVNTLNIFPNPAQDKITITTPDKNEKIHVSIKDLTGRTVLSEWRVTHDSQVELKVSLINGAYIVTVYSAHSKSLSKILFINN